MLHLSFEDEEHVEVARHISHFDISSETDSHVRHEDHSLLVIRVLKNGVTLIFQINLIAIMAMGRLYEYMAERLTVWGEIKR